MVPVDGAMLLDVRPVRLTRSPRQHVATFLLVTTVASLGGLQLLSRVEWWISGWPLLLLAWGRELLHALGRGARRLHLWHSLRRVAAVGGARHIRDGSWIRLTGRVLEGTGFQGIDGHKGCVIAFYLGRLGHPKDPAGQTLAEVHAVDFDILGPDGEIVHIPVKDARFVNRPAPGDTRLHDQDALAWWKVPLPDGRDVVAAVKHQELVRAGDAVEVVGYLQREIDPSATGGYRSPALRLVLRGDAGRQLLIRGRSRPG